MTLTHNVDRPLPQGSQTSTTTVPSDTSLQETPIVSTTASSSSESTQTSLDQSLSTSHTSQTTSISGTTTSFPSHQTSPSQSSSISYPSQIVSIMSNTTTSSLSPQISQHQSPLSPYPSPPYSSKSNFPLGAIIGIVVGSVAILFAISTLIWIRRRRSRGRLGFRHIDGSNGAAPATQVGMPRPTIDLMDPSPRSARGNLEPIHRELAPSAQRAEKPSRRFPQAQQGSTTSYDSDEPARDPLPERMIVRGSSDGNSRPELGSEGFRPAVGGDPLDLVDERVEVLQAEIARLRAHPDSSYLLEAPPAYER
jgi:hypothetical protein